MNSKLTNAVKNLSLAAKKHSPEILTGIGIAGMLTTTIMAVRATPKALMLIEEEKRRQNRELYENAKSDYAKEYLADHQIERLTAKEVIKVTWRCYIPVFSIGMLSTMCLVGASSANLKRNTALATAYALSESALKEYQGKVVEELGEKKEHAIRDAIAKDRIEKQPVKNSEVIITEKGNTLCYDVISGRYFKSDIDKLKKAENDLNRQMRDENYISLNEFYYEIGLDGIKIGDDLGWNIDRGYIDLDFSSLLTEDGTPCIVVDYNLAPRYDYR